MPLRMETEAEAPAQYYPYVSKGDSLLAPALAKLTEQEQIWEGLADYINHHFYRPDLEALRAVLAAVHAHYSPGDPVWLFGIGPSGSGKTSIVITCISGLPDVVVCSDLTPRSLLVGNPDERNERSLLNKPSLILAFKDFTTMISKREEDQREIIATLREVYDGHTSRKTATVNRVWNGKATVIAAVTPAIERAWAIHRDLGERFCQVRWANSHDPAKLAKVARSQQGKEKEIAESMRELTRLLFAESEGLQGAPLSESDGDKIDAAATLVAKLRCHVVRDSTTARPIIEVSASEEPTRLSKSAANVASYHASLFGRSEVSPKDMATAMRVITDTVPASRMKIMQAIPPDSTTTITASDIRELTGVHKNTVLWQTDELEAIGALRIGKNLNDERTVAITKDFEELWLKAGF